jgi:hypothetical protein
MYTQDAFVRLVLNAEYRLLLINSSGVCAAWLVTMADNTAKPTWIILSNRIIIVFGFLASEVQKPQLSVDSSIKQKSVTNQGLVSYDYVITGAWPKNVMCLNIEYADASRLADDIANRLRGCAPADCEAGAAICEGSSVFRSL